MSEPTDTYRALDPQPPTESGGPPLVYPPGAAPAAPAGGVGRYRLGEELARGGMGVVYRAEDLSFGREVAVKVLGPGLAGAAAARFVAEARITGRLQHPAIPPVHDLGTLPDGRPFLAMKLIRGQTFAEKLRRREDPGDDLEQHLETFVAVCQAVAYAHARGVIHRDLKPGNVMVGAFGEVQVMDWGLAKDLNAQAPEVGPDPLAETISFRPGGDTPGAADATRAGAVLGTPAYMPPEQARGELHRIGPRSDVFGLGAILCELLTGLPPYLGRSAASVWQQAAAAGLDDAFARLERARLPAHLYKLVALTRRCLDPVPDVRPAHAGELAAAVHAVRTGGQEFRRQREIDRAVAEVQEAERKARRVGQVGLYLGLFAVFGGALVSYGFYNRGHSRADELEQELAKAKEKLASRPSSPPPKSEPAKPAPAVSAADRRQQAREEAAALLDVTGRWRSAASADPLAGLFGQRKPLTADERQALRRVRDRFEKLVPDLDRPTAARGYLLLTGLSDEVGEEAEGDRLWKAGLAAYRADRDSPPLPAAVETLTSQVRSARRLTAADRRVASRARAALAEEAKVDLSDAYRRQVAKAFEQLAAMWDGHGAPQESRRDWRGAARAYRKLADAESPSDSDRLAAVKALVGLGRAQLRCGEPADAAGALAQARPYLEAAGRLFPSSEQRALRRDNLALMAEARLTLGDHAAAAEEAAELAGLTDDRAGNTYAAAWVLAWCVSLAEKDGKLSDAERKVLAKQYAERAVAKLRQATERGFGDAKKLSDPAWEALRTRDDFKAAAAELEGKAKK